jgi:hypothetical protein
MRKNLTLLKLTTSHCMQKIFFFLLCVATATLSFAQVRETVVLEPGVTSLEGLQGKVHQYPQFTQGVVHFKNGNRGKSRMNVSLFTGEILFLAASGDTLALSNEEDISFIEIGQDTFYFGAHQFLKQIKSFADVKIASFQKIKEIERRKTGGYGETLSGAVASWSFINIRKLFVELSPLEKIVLSKETTYYVGNTDNEFLPLNKGNILKAVPSARQKLAKNYLQKQTVDFNKPGEVETFLNWVYAQPV